MVQRLTCPVVPSPSIHSWPLHAPRIAAAFRAAVASVRRERTAGATDEAGRICAARRSSKHLPQHYGGPGTRSRLARFEPRSSSGPREVSRIHTKSSVECGMALSPRRAACLSRPALKAPASGDFRRKKETARTIARPGRVGGGSEEILSVPCVEQVQARRQSLAFQRSFRFLLAPRAAELPALAGEPAW